MNLSAQQVRPYKFHRNFFRSFTGHLPVKDPGAVSGKASKFAFFSWEPVSPRHRPHGSRFQAAALLCKHTGAGTHCFLVSIEIIQSVCLGLSYDKGKKSHALIPQPNQRAPRKYAAPLGLPASFFFSAAVVTGDGPPDDQSPQGLAVKGNHRIEIAAP